MLAIVLGILVVLGYLAVLFALVPSGLGAAAWPFFAAIALPSLLCWVARVLASLVERAFDRRSLAELPMGGAVWAEEQLAPLGLGDHRVTRSGDRDAYDSDRREIILSENSSVERTVRAWASAAHELGHAVMRQRCFSVLDFGLNLCRAYWSRFFYAGLGLCVAGIMLGFEPAIGAARVAWIAAVTLACGQLVDEFGASAIALGLLARSGALTRAQLLGSAVYLAAMFGTYVMAAVAVVPFLLAPHYLAAQIGSGLADGSAGPLAGWEIAVILATALLVLAAVIEMLVHAMQGKFPTFKLVLWAGIALPLVLLLTWDQPVVLDRPWLVLLAFIPTYEILASPIVLAASVGGWSVSRLCRALVPSSQWRDRMAPAPNLTKGPRTAASARARLIGGLAELVHLILFLPLLWFLLLG